MYYNTTMNVGEGLFVSLTSTSQNLNAASKSDMVLPSKQFYVVSPSPRMPGLGEDLVLYVAPDFDETLEFPHVNP